MEKDFFSQSQTVAQTLLRWCLIAGLTFLIPIASRATNHQIRMDTLMAGLSGDPSIQFLQMVVNGNSQKDWGPQGSETASRAMLVFFDGAGNQVGQFNFPSDPPIGSNTVLIATAAFTNRTGLRADFIIPPLIAAGSGKVCFKGNPANPFRFTVNLCLSYGSFPTNLTEGAGLPAVTLPITGDPKGLVRFQNFSFGDLTSRNGDFRIGFPSPTNTSGQTFSFTVPGPKIQVSRLIDFGSQNILGGATPPVTISIGNSGFSNSLSITSVTFTGINTNQFRILSDSGQSLLGPGASRTLVMDFDPSSLGVKNALLRISCNDTNEPLVDVTLQGTGSDLNPCSVPNLAAALAQDISSAAQVAGPGIIYTGTTVGSTRDGSITCGGASTNTPDVWYKYVAASNGTLVVSLVESSFDTVLSAHSSAPGTTTNQIVCNDNFIQTQSQITFLVTNGVEVFLRIAGFNGATGAFQMKLTGPNVFNFDRNTNGINDNCEIDFGDAPTNYPTLLASNGARHKAVTGLFLGRRVDVETDAQANALATGDNLNGPPNDDDGVTFLSTLRVNQVTSVAIVGSAVGILNAWIDFNADGDWADTGEQIFLNRSIGPITNTLTFLVPANAVVTNRTFARFRFSSTNNLTFTGLANDGEVEDYAVEILSATNATSSLGVRINEVMAGFNGDSTVQFVELEINDDTNRFWGPQGGETVGRAMLVFSGAAGEQVGRFVFPGDAPAQGLGKSGTVLIATREFVERTGLQPDFLMPPDVMPVSGKVSFRNNPDNSQFNINIALSYGGNGFFGQTDGAGPANLNQLPIMDARSLRRTQEFGFGLNLNGGFTLGTPTPANSAGQTFTFPSPASLEQQGKTLFTKETFRGNGRTCASCHVEGKDQFGLSPATIASLLEDDPLFVFEQNVNQLKLTARSQPSDLRGVITSANGSAKILAGSGDTYLVIDGNDLFGILTDSNGNTGTFQSITSGNLDGPTASNGSGRGLEDHQLLEHGRGLILENIDGFDKPEVFRASPHLLNLALTAPYGLSGEFNNLRDFSDGAVKQHFPRSLSRVSGVDFRPPTAQELQALEAFQNTIGNPTSNTNKFNLDQLATTEAQKRGRQLFFSDQSKCFKCHSGPVFSQADGSLPGTLLGKNENFNTGVANGPINSPSVDNLPSEPAGFAHGQSTRKFNVPPLFGIRLTAPYFHDGSAPDLEEAVEFYDSIEFVGSTAGTDVGATPASNQPQKVADLVAFLESLVELPVNFTRELPFDLVCPSGPSSLTLTAVVTNLGTNTLTITNVVINGTNAAEFQITGGGGTTNLAPGQFQNIEVTFQPQTLGHKQATLEITADDGSVLSNFSFGIALTGSFVDNAAGISPGLLNFGTRDIDEPLSPTPQSVAIVNTGTLGLEILNLSLVGSNAVDFQILTNALPTNVPSGGTNFVQVVFVPQTQGAKTAQLRINSLACSNSLVDVALNGTATSTLHHFAWDTISSPQNVTTPFPVTVTAQDRNNDKINEFAGTVNLIGTVGVVHSNAVLISEIDPGTPDAVEFANVSGQSVNVSGWRVTIYDETVFPSPLVTVTIPTNSIIPSGGIFTLVESGAAPGTFPNLFTGTNIFWTGGTASIAVLLRDAQSNLVDFVTTGASSSITNPATIPLTHWNSAGIPFAALDDVTSYQRIGVKDNNIGDDWLVASRNLGTNNPGLIAPFPTNRAIALAPVISSAFVDGIWDGTLSVPEEFKNLLVTASDNAGHNGTANLFDVAGGLPTISNIADLGTDEDVPTALLPFTISDAEVAAENLIVTAASSNTNLIPIANIFLGGSVGNRTVRIAPATNQFGTVTITLNVTDGISTSSNSFVLTVNPVNDAPAIVPPFPNFVINEGVLNLFPMIATDVDGADTLTFVLATAPLGMIMESNGVFSWTPTEAQGPGTYAVSIVVNDNGTPSLSATQDFTASVFELNSAPVLAVISNRNIYAENLFSITNVASDSDVPTNTLTFSLVTPPTGAAINSTNGVFTWTPNASQSPSTNLIRVKVADNGSPSLSVTQGFNLTVVKVPVDFARTLDFGTQCSTNFTNTLSVTLTNTASNTLMIASTLLKGTNAAEFQIVSDTGETNLAPGEIRRIEIRFLPQALGNKQAILEITANENGTVENFIFNVALTGLLLDNELQVSAATLNFGIASIDSLVFTTNTFVITNNGSANLKILSLGLTGPNPADFKITSDTGQTNLASGATRTLKIAFIPTRRGEKFAILQIDSLACSGAFQEIFMAGTASSVLTQFVWNVASSNQNVNTPFAAQIIAQDRNGDLVENFSGTANFSGSVGGSSNKTVLISEINPGNPDAVEFVNVSGAPVDVSGWRIVIYDPSPTVLSTTIIPSNSIIAANGLFRITELGVAPGTFPNLFNGVSIGWVGTTTTASVLLQNPQGAIVDFATRGTSSSISSPVVIPSSEWSGAGISVSATDGVTSFQRRGTNDNNTSIDWITTALTIGTTNVGLTVPFPGSPRPVLINPTNSTAFLNGVWNGSISVLEEVTGMRLTASDGNGHTGTSGLLTFVGQAPTISDVADVFVNEDIPIPAIPFVIGDLETATSNLVVTARSSNTNLVSNSSLVLGGNSSSTNRTVTILPAANQFGTTTITLTVSDGAQTNSDTFLVTVSTMNDLPVLPSPTSIFVENFDLVTAPNLPSSWIALGSAAVSNMPPWQTVTNFKDTGVNSVFIPDIGTNSDSQLTSIPILISSANAAQLTFRHSFNTDTCCDGGTLEISINSGAFTNITLVGGTFLTNGYNNGNLWSGNSGGFITTVVNLPTNSFGQNTRFRWRFISDGANGGDGWFVDSVSITDGFLSNMILNEDVPSTNSFTISDVETSLNLLTLSATSLNPTLIPNGNITFSGTTSPRTMIIRPATNQFGTATILLSLGDGETNVTRSIFVTVNPVNDPPVFTAVGDQVVNEGTLLAITNVVTDVDSPTNLISFSFVTIPLSAMVLNSNGLFTWTPGETHGPAVHAISLRATDNGSPSQSATQTFSILVREVNSPPALAGVGDQTVYVGELLIFTNSATDLDFPANFLSFSISTPPGNAVINSTNGRFTWTPTEAHLGANVILMRVTDNGTPSFTSEQSVAVEVILAPAIISANISGNAFMITWNSFPGKKYRVQFKFALDDLNWTDLPGDITASSFAETKANVISQSQRFFRVILVP